MTTETSNMTVLNLDTRVPVHAWLPHFDIEPGALEQITNTANHPEAVEHVAVMPDCHQGYGVAIGTAFMTEGSIVPNAVGVDIGCGVNATRTNVTLKHFDNDQDQIKKVAQSWARLVRERIPTGFGVHKDQKVLPRGVEVELAAVALHKDYDEKAAPQFGTLGGGNHFLELAVDDEEAIWFLVHSGSRGIGNQIARHYHKLAKEQSRKRKLDTISDLASLQLDSDDGVAYMVDMFWAMDYAWLSRARMAYSMWESLREALQEIAPWFANSVMPIYSIDVPHNYAKVRDNISLHRKGATDAAIGRRGIIPGSMGTNSYVVTGSAGHASLESCSHGAGRRMSRRKAKESITLADMEYALQDTFTKADTRDADEAPQAYKDIDLVMARQDDLVTITHTLRPLITVKGSSKASDD